MLHQGLLGIDFGFSPDKTVARKEIFVGDELFDNIRVEFPGAFSDSCSMEGSGVIYEVGVRFEEFDEFLVKVLFWHRVVSFVCYVVASLNYCARVSQRAMNRPTTN